jgi:predicted O-methyltransferase YrrM
MNPVLEEIYETADRTVLRSGISRLEGDIIHQVILANDVNITIEIGCAFGFSSLFICDALAHRENPRHIIIDPNQNVHYDGKGVANLRRAGFAFFELIEKPSELALPLLLKNGKEFDFALIDGFHTFDHTMLDFFFLNRMLRVGGLLAIDDNEMPSVHRVVRYIANYPCYRLLTAANVRGRQRRLLNRFKRGLGTLLRPVTRAAGAELSHEFLDHSLVETRSISMLDYSTMVIFQKIHKDMRDFDWYEHF